MRTSAARGPGVRRPATADRGQAARAAPRPGQGGPRCPATRSQAAGPSPIRDGPRRWLLARAVLAGLALTSTLAAQPATGLQERPPRRAGAQDALLLRPAHQLPLLSVAPGRPAVDEEQLELSARRLQSLQLVRQAADARAGTAAGLALARQLGAFERGELSLGDLSARTLELAPQLADATDAEVLPWRPEVLDWSVGARLGQDSFLGLATRLAEAEAAADQQDVQLVALGRADGHAFVQLDAWTAPGDERYRFLQDDRELATVKALQGVELKPGEQVWWYDRTRIEQQVAGSDALPFCGLIVNAERGVADGAVDGDVDVALLEVWASFRQSPLGWLEGSGPYGSGVVLGLRRVAGSARVARLPRPVTIELSAEGAGAAAVPERVTLQTVGEESADIDLRCQRGDGGGPVALVAHLAGQAFRFEASLGARTSSLRFSVGDGELAGFGLGRTRLTVERLAEDGLPLAEESALEVSPVIVNGVLLDGPALIEAGQSRSAPLTVVSRGLGELSVSARVAPLGVEEARVTLGFPWLVLLASLLGGALGGWLRWTSRDKSQGAAATPAGDTGERDEPAGAERSGAADSGGAAWVRVVVGAAVGTAAVVGVLSGLLDAESLPSDVVGSVAGAFVVALVGGYVGRALLETIARRLGLIPAD